MANVMGAVGSATSSDFSTGGCTVRDKATSKAGRHLSQYEFFSQVESAGSLDPPGDTNAPWTVYAPVSKR